MMRADSICWQVEKLGFNIAAMLSLLSLWWSYVGGDVVADLLRPLPPGDGRCGPGDQSGVSSVECGPMRAHLAPTTWQSASCRLPADIASFLLSTVTLRGPTEKSQNTDKWLGTHTHISDEGGTVSYWGGVMIRPTHFIKQTLLGGHI